ncbi:hypothetical protein EDD86DRAFT_242914 [Gorgonomyces haynaldii]|nr:hypothetical protein EDD86DRAFT_242914 [Gorgonomyces haynaldii]
MSTKTNEAWGTPFYPMETLKKMKKKAVVHSPPQNDQETAVFRSPLSKDLHRDFGSVKTVYELLDHSFKKFPNQPCLGTRYFKNGQWSQYEFKTYAQLEQDRKHFGAGVYQIQQRLSGLEEWYLGIFSINRYEWLVSDLGAQCYSVPFVALYDTLGPETSEFILNHAEVPVLCLSLDKVPQIIELAPKCPKLKALIVYDTIPTAETGNTLSPFKILKQWASQKGLQLFKFEEVIEIGKKNPVPFKPPKQDDVFCLSYTSGTTGNPKGAMLTHLNMISTVRAGLAMIEYTHEDVHISYLPLAHIFERMMMLLTLSAGASAGFYRGDVTLLIDDIGVLRPTLFASVPRLLNRIYDKIMQGALHSGSAVKAALFQKAWDAKVHHLQNDGSLTHSVWDPLVFNKVKALLGGRVKIVVSASAPITGQTLEFLRVALGCQVLEAYGQTESCGGLTVSWPGDYTKGHVGGPLSNTEIKLVSVPEMGYHAKDLKGEIWSRGPGTFKGYLKDPEKTKDTITPDGWLKTGDIGTIDQHGHLSIVDRKKNIFKLSQGEYVAPEKLENVFVKSAFIAQVYVHGDSLQNELVGIVVPDAEVCVKWGISKGLLPQDTPAPEPTAPGKPPSKSIVALSKTKELNQLILDDMKKLGIAQKLRGFEFVKAIHLDAVPFSIEEGILTPTFKLKRNEVAQKYRPQIDAMYQELNAKPQVAKL